MSKEMLINTVKGQESRIAIVNDGLMEELYVERASNASHVGNVYKGRVTNVEPGIQAAFIDFGLAKNGFLHISDVRPDFFPAGARGGTKEVVGRKRAHRDRPPIQECLKRGQEIIVQLTKEGIGTKGPTLTTYLSIPGRLLVMMPGMSRLGVSRKVEDEDIRAKARAILAEINTPPDMGFIVRTAGIDKPKRDLQRDLAYLARLWKTLENRAKTARAPAELYQESDLVTRTLRDIYNTDIDRIICDSQDVAHRVLEFLTMVMPRTNHKVEVYTGSGGLFHDTGLDDEIERIHSRRVEMASGGSLVIDQAEALVAIDVNSGRYREQRNAEQTALKINLEAAVEIVRQLRLRDLGGVIVIDFIDMREEKHRRELEKALREAMKPDRAKSKTLKISAFGIVEMTRQRMRASLTHNIYTPCPRCNGDGIVKSDESMSLQVLRSLQRACANETVAEITVSVIPKIAETLVNTYRKHLVELEERTGRQIRIRANADMPGSQVLLTAVNARGSEVAWESAPCGKGTTTLQTARLEDLPALPPAPAEEPTPDGEKPAETPTDQQADPEAKPKKSRRRRGGRKHKKSTKVEGDTDAPAEAPPAESADKPAEPAAPDDESAEQPPPAKANKSRRRGGRKHKKPTQAKAQGEGDADAPAEAQPTEESAAEKAPQDKPKKPRRRRRSSKKKTEDTAQTASDDPPQPPELPQLPDEPEKAQVPDDEEQQRVNARVAEALLAEREAILKAKEDISSGLSPADLLAGKHHEDKKG